MGAEGSKEITDFNSGHGGTWSDMIDVAAFEAERHKMREINRMDQVVRSRFQQGVKYNMKVLIRGYKKTGKSLLWRRFQGLPFSDENATINWTSPTSCTSGSSDAVKVDVWDVVDKAIHTNLNAVNRISTADIVYNLDQEAYEGKHTLKLLDVTAVDVYQGAHAVVFMVNPFDAQSLQYVRDKHTTVPGHICILIMLNFRDQTDNPPPNQQIQVTIEDVTQLCALIRSYRSNLATDDVTAIQTSLKDGFGLLHLHHYLDIPFLRLKQRALQEQLARVELDLESCSAHITNTVRTARYDDYLRNRAALKNVERENKTKHEFPSKSKNGGEGGSGDGARSPREAYVTSTSNCNDTTHSSLASTHAVAMGSATGSDSGNVNGNERAVSAVVTEVQIPARAPEHNSNLPVTPDDQPPLHTIAPLYSGNSTTKRSDECDNGGGGDGDGDDGVTATATKCGNSDACEKGNEAGNITKNISSDSKNEKKNNSDVDSELGLSTELGGDEMASRSVSESGEYMSPTSSEFGAMRKSKRNRSSGGGTSTSGIERDNNSSDSSDDDGRMAQKVGFSVRPLSNVKDKNRPGLRKVGKRPESKSSAAAETPSAPAPAPATEAATEAATEEASEAATEAATGAATKAATEAATEAAHASITITDQAEVDEQGGEVDGVDL